MPLKFKSEPAPVLSEERMQRINPEVNQRLDGFIQANSKMHAYYSGLVKEQPDRAVRAFMLNKMFKQEAELRVVARQAPQAKEWLDRQTPEVKQRVAERLETVNPNYRPQAEVRIIAQEKTRIDFTPAPRMNQGISV